MAPSAIYEPVSRQELLKSDIHKIRDAPFVYRNELAKKPVADDYMYAFKYNFPLPAHGKGGDVLDFTPEEEADAGAIAGRFLKELEQVIESRDAEAFAGLFVDSGEMTVKPGVSSDD